MRFKNLCLAFGLGAMILFVGCGSEDSKKAQSIQDMPLKKWEKESVLEKLGMAGEHKRFYYLEGNVGQEKAEAYAWISYSQIKLRIFPVLDSQSPRNEAHSLESTFAFSEVELGVISGAFTLKGEISQADGARKSFELKQKIQNPLSEVVFVKNIFETSQDVQDIDEASKNEVSGSNGQALTYSKKTTKAFIPAHNALSSQARDHLNYILAQGAQSKQSLQETLALEAKKGFVELTKDGGGLVFNVEQDEDIDVAYVDDRLIMFKASNYIYEGGAHGAQQLSVQAYWLQNGEKISNMIEDLFTPTQDKILALLSQKLGEKYKNELFEDSLPLKSLPETFFIDPLGVAFIWQPYELAPHSSGFIGAELSFQELKTFANPKSVYGYLFDKDTF